MFVVIVVAASIWQLPRLLRSVPSRYVAALPEVVQSVGQREHVAILPTALPRQNNAEISGILQQPPLPPPIVTMVSTAPSPSAPVTALMDRDSLNLPLKPTAEPTATPYPLASAGRLEGIVHQFQDWNNCGPATLAAGLSYFGLNLSQYEIADVLKPDPEDRNVSPSEIARYVNDLTEYEAMDRVDGTLDQLKRFISIGAPVMVEIGFYPPGDYAWMDWFGHYLLLVGYDDEKEHFFVYDSWLGTSDVPGENLSDRGRTVSYLEMDRLWGQFSRSYIVMFDSDQRTLVELIVGDAMDDEQMWLGALETAQMTLAQSPEDEFGWFSVGTAYNALGDNQHAAAAFDMARSLGLPWRMLWYQFGPYQAYYETGRYQDIIDLADVTLMHRPYFEESYYYKGLALAAQGDIVAARNELERAIEFNPRYQPASDALADIENADT